MLHPRMRISHDASPEGSDATLLLQDIDGQASESDDDISALTTRPVVVGLGRHLDLYSTTLLIIGRMVGTGIFSTPSSITRSVGSVGAALILWALGFAISFCGLFVWLEYGCMFPVSGGEKVYLEAAYPRPRLLATILCGVQMLLLSSCAASSIIFAENSSLAFNGNTNASDGVKRAIAVLAVFAVSVLHALVPKWAVTAMNTLSMMKIFILSFIVLSGLFVLTWGIDSIPDPHASFHHVFSGSSHSSYDYAVALLKVLATYSGWSNAAYVLGEVKNPVRTLKIAGPLALGTVGVLYTLTNIAYFSSATPKEISESGTTVAAFFLGKVFGGSARTVAAVFVALSALGNVMTVSFSLSRVQQELAKEDILPFSSFWARTSSFGTPAATLLFVFLTSSTTILAIPFGDAYNFILDVMGYPHAIIGFFVTIGLFILRYRSPQLSRPFRVWSPVALIFLTVQVFLIVTPFIPPAGGIGDTTLPYWMAPAVSIGLLVCGITYWFIWRVAMPRFGGYSWMAKEIQLGGGTAVKTWQAVKHKRGSRDEYSVG